MTIFVGITLIMRNRSPLTFSLC